MPFEANFENNIGKFVELPGWSIHRHLGLGLIVGIEIDEDAEYYKGFEVDPFVKYVIMFSDGSISYYYGDQVAIQEG